MTTIHPIELWAQAFASVDWLVPPFLQMQFISKCAIDIAAAPDRNKPDVFKAIAESIYDENHLADMFVGLYSKTMHIKDFKQQIFEAIEASFFGLDHAAVATLITVIEGIIRKLALSQGRDVGIGTQKLISELTHLIEKEEASPNRFVERIVMWTSLRDFFSEKLLKNTKTYVGADEFNRHGILHGIYDKYGDKANFYRCITIVELLCFTMAFFYGGSCFAPEPTQQSAKLEKYLAGLKNLSVKAESARRDAMA